MSAVTSPNRGPGPWILLLLAVLLWGGQYLRRGLWEPDEARYAYVAREMHDDGHWFVPHLHGEPYPDKPPLMFWLMNGASLLTGGEINGFSARLPTLLGAVLALWATARLMERWRDGAAAWRSVGVLGTAYLFWWQGGWGQIDMLLCGLEMMSLWCFFTASDPGRGRRFLGAWIFLGLALLAKGPPALVAPVVYLAVTWASGEAALLKRWHWAWGLLLASAIPGVWLWLAWHAGATPDYFAAMFGQKSFARVLADHHAQPFYYYLPHFLGEFLPWTLLLPAAWRGLGPGPQRRRLLAWVLTVLVFFSLSVGKRNLYVLLAWPGAAMLVAAGWDGLTGLSRRWQAVTCWSVMALVTVIGLGETGVIAAALSGGIRHADRVLGPNPSAPWMLLPGALVMLGGSAVLIAWFRRQGPTRRWMRLLVGLFAVHWMVTGLLVLPTLNAAKAPLELTAEARDQLAPGQPIYLYRDQLAIIALYSGHPGRYLQTPEDVARVLDSGRFGIIVFDQEDWDEVGGPFVDRVRARPFRMGSKKLVWVDFPHRAANRLSRLAPGPVVRGEHFSVDAVAAAVRVRLGARQACRKGVARRWRGGFRAPVTSLGKDGSS